MSSLTRNIQQTDTLFDMSRDSGADLSTYQEQLARERSSRTLNLRRSARPSIAGLLGRKDMQQQQQQRVKLFDTTNFPFLDPGYCANVLTSGNAAAIHELLHNIATVFQATPRLLMNLIQSEDVSESLVLCLQEDIAHQLMIEILQVIGTIYPKCGQNQEKFVDNGLTFCMLGFLQSDDVSLVTATIACLSLMAEASTYARDSIFCVGLHTDIINIAAQESSPELTVIACDALDTIFSNPEEIDYTYLTPTIVPITSLLNLSNVIAVKSIIQCLVSITNKKPSLVFKLFELGLGSPVVGFLSHEELIGATLPLIGNMSVSHFSNIRMLLESGLLDILFHLMGSNYTAEVFWVLSNLVEGAPHLLIDAFDANFIHLAIQAGMEADYDVKKEAAFFLATLIVYSPQENMPLYVAVEVTEIFESMIGCGVGLIVLRCLDALVKLARFILQNDAPGEFIESLTSGDMKDSLENVLTCGSVLVTERANFLLSLVDTDHLSHAL